jgi:hypothetical protein
VSVVLDASALIAFDRGDRRVAALLEAARRRRDRVATSSGCVAQAWRAGGPNQALLARLLQATDERPLDPTTSKIVGGLCAKTWSDDVVDAHVAVLARDGDVLVTSDPGDLRRLLGAVGTRVELTTC